MPNLVYECDTCNKKFAAKAAALECHPAITIWYACDDKACDYLYSDEDSAAECDHLEAPDA